MSALYRKTVIWAGITLAAYLIFFFFFDKPIDLWAHANWAETGIFQAGTYISYLADGSFLWLAVALCFILILIIDPSIRKQWSKILLYICICFAVSIVIGEGLKYLLARYRPVMLFDHDLYGLHFFSADWNINSTPSDHTIRAFSIFTALALYYRRLAVLFIAVAVLVGLSRIAVTAHYLSDVIFGAYIGIFTSLWVNKKYFHGKKAV